MTDVEKQMASLYEEMQQIREKINKLQRQQAGEEVKNHELYDTDGNVVKLYDLFGDKEDLILIHNMGKGCVYCTLWADGFNGSYQHLEDRAGFALVSQDDPATAKEFSKSRDWKFKVLSNNKGEFSRAMGYQTDDGKVLPGVSTFHRDASGKVTRIAHTMFGPGDDFCPQWHILAMLKDGDNDWQPKYKY